MRMRYKESLSVAVLLVLAIAGCGRALAPTEASSAATRAAASGAAIEPGPGQPAPEEGGPATPVPFPSATFIDPRPSPLVLPILPPTYTFRWSPNVPVPGGPVPTRYRYKLFDENGTDFDFTTILVNPDSLLRFYAPGFAGWPEVDASVTQVTLHDLDPGQKHILVLVATSGFGHYDRVLSFSRNALYFYVNPALVVDRGNDGTR